jgi:hypothetical protein
VAHRNQATPDAASGSGDLTLGKEGTVAGANGCGGRLVHRSSKRYD